MRYRSTRGSGEPVSFTDIVLSGIAPDGGLYVPARRAIPLAFERVRVMRSMSYPEIATEVMMLFAPELKRAWWEETLAAVYVPSRFGNHAYPVVDDEMIPIRKVGGNIHVADLSTGPTLAFKDWALQLLAPLFAKVSKDRRLTIIGATSGDTGSAAIEALRGSGIPVFMLSPEHGMSEFQKAQMYSVRDPHIHNLAIRGSFDDCQRIVKELNADEAFKREYGVGAVNSINWARIAAQVVYYFYIYSRMWGVHYGRALDVVVPSGNFGNAYAALTARAYGVNLGKVMVATNENDVLYQFWKSGLYAPHAKTVTTMSPSMDITAASNLERFVYDVCTGDTTTVAHLYKRLQKGGQFDVSYVHDRIKLYLDAALTTEAMCRKTIRAVYEHDGVVIDPHTAVAVSAAERFRDSKLPVVALSTAQPCKFDDTIRSIIGTAAPRPPAFSGIESRDQFVTVLDSNSACVKEFVISALGG